MSKLFELGQLVMTKGVAESVKLDEVTTALDRYTKGDWGNMCDEDNETNNFAVDNEQRLMGEYLDSNKVKFWIITEWDRSVTTVLLPSEY